MTCCLGVGLEAASLSSELECCLDVPERFGRRAESNLCLDSSNVVVALAGKQCKLDVDLRSKGTCNTNRVSWVEGVV